MKRVLLYGLLAAAAAGVFQGAAEIEVRFDLPALITSAGQSAEVQLANVLAKRADLAVTLNKTAEAADLKGNNTLILVLGVSLKGLGAAGIDSAQERTRVENLLKAAVDRNVPVLCLHLGGEARRGDLSDEMIRICLPFASAVLVVRDGNRDGLFTSICRDHGIPLYEVEKTAHALEPLKTIFGKAQHP